jgi:hypothetical protein
LSNATAIRCWRGTMRALNAANTTQGAAPEGLDVLPGPLTGARPLGFQATRVFEPASPQFTTCTGLSALVYRAHGPRPSAPHSAPRRSRAAKSVLVQKPLRLSGFSNVNSSPSRTSDRYRPNARCDAGGFDND